MACVVGLWACRKVPLLVNFLDVDILHSLLRDGLHQTKYVVLKNKFNFFSILMYSRKEISHLRLIPTNKAFKGKTFSSSGRLVKFFN